MTGPHQNSPLDEKTKAKIVSLFRDHKVSVAYLSERYGRSFATIKKVLAEAGVIDAREP